MLQEMKFEDAIKKYLKGRKVLALTDLSIDKDHQDYELAPLEDVLARMRYLVDIPAVENPDFKEAVHQMVTPEKLPPPRSLPRKKQRQRLWKLKEVLHGSQEGIPDSCISTVSTAERQRPSAPNISLVITAVKNAARRRS